MRILLYEHLTAAGHVDSSLYREGRAMRDALAIDLQSIPAVELVTERPDFAFVIAPETDGILEEQVARFRRECPVIAPSAEALALTKDKLALARHWQSFLVPTPYTTSAHEWRRSRRPAVVKPRDGAGSCATRLVQDDEDLCAPGRIAQDFVPGRAVSVAYLIGPRQTLALPPGEQCLSDDGAFQYLGGELPLPEPLASRAVALGLRAIDCVPGLAGYVGVDLVLGDSPDGREDRAIEINPRLTTSYIGLRALARSNLAVAILAIYRGTSVEPLIWKSDRVRFRPDGQVTALAG